MRKSDRIDVKRKWKIVRKVERTSRVCCCCWTTRDECRSTWANKYIEWQPGQYFNFSTFWNVSYMKQKHEPRADDSRHKTKLHRHTEPNTRKKPKCVQKHSTPYRWNAEWISFFVCARALLRKNFSFECSKLTAVYLRACWNLIWLHRLRSIANSMRLCCFGTWYLPANWTAGLLHLASYRRTNEKSARKTNFKNMPD